jgi:TonB family protein
MIITVLNYILEANIALILLWFGYLVLLKNETNFTIVRILLLLGVVMAIALPFIHFQFDNGTTTLPSLSHLIPTNWLPEVVVGNVQADNSTQRSKTMVDFWFYVGIIYWTGVAISALLFIIQFGRIIRLMSLEKAEIRGLIKIINLSNTDTTFSFFNYVFVGKSNDLSLAERQRIIEHEITHVQQWHSFDIVLMRFLKIAFWFNPCIDSLKKIFVELHEFEADARAVKNSDVNNYCSLLARVALKSAGISIANHFNNSLTIKRIEMIKKIKSKIKWWKITAFTMTLAGVFVFIACQDQINASSENLGGLPLEAQGKFAAFKRNHPGETFIVEYDDRANQKLGELDNQYGKALHIELFTITHAGKQKTFSMLQYSLNSESNEIYETVDESPEYFEDGFNGLVGFLGSNIKYPSSAREKAIEGTSFISFIVEKDGSVSDVQTIRGFDHDCDVESERVVKQTKWVPAKIGGKRVRAKYVLPIKFKL